MYLFCRAENEAAIYVWSDNQRHYDNRLQIMGRLRLTLFLERIVQLLFKNSDFVLAVTFQNLLF